MARPYKENRIPKRRGQITAEGRGGAFRSPEAEAKSAALAALNTLGECTLAQVLGFMQGYGLEAAPDERGVQTALNTLVADCKATINGSKWRTA